MSFLTGTVAEMLFSSRADYTAVASSATEASLLAGVNEQPWLPAGFFDQGNRGYGRAIRIEASGVFSNTGTPTLIFQARLGSTAGSAALGGASVGVSKAITTTSGVSNVYWRLILDIVCATPGIGTGNTTLICNGKVESPAGFASPFVYSLEPTTPEVATWTATVDNSLNLYANLSITWSASSSSNTITLKELLAFGWN